MKLKKLLVNAAIVAAVMIIAACPAAASVTPSANDTAPITVTNVEHGATVKAYRVVNAEYSSAGLTGYKTASGVTIANLEKPTLEEVQKITVDIQNGKLNVPSFDLNDVTPADSHSIGDGSSACTYRSKNVKAGMYLVLVKGVSGNIYNPAIISVGYDSSSNLKSGSLDLNSAKWTVSGETVEVKHSKVAVSKDTKDGIRSFSFNDTISYVVKAGIPSYDGSVYKNVVYRLIDNADEGLLFDKNSVSVTDASGKTVKQENYTVSLTGQTLTVDFSSDWILANGGTTVTVRYDAKLSTKATLDYAANINEVKIVYSNDPSSKGGASPYDDPNDPGMPTADSAVYTFDFSFRKVDSKVPDILLKDAVFSLTGTNTTGDEVTYQETSSEKGIVHFSGLSEGTYVLTETLAPKGYAVNQNTYTVTVKAVYKSDKRLSKYTITVKDQNGTEFMNKTYSATPEVDGSDCCIPNTAFQSLPATGGVGTLVFTLAGGIMIMAGTVVLLRIKKRPEA